MKLIELDMYKVGVEIGNSVWELVNKFPVFAKDTVGKQFVRAADSVAANISEGEGSYYQGDKIRYLYYARASLYETGTWLSFSLKRGLIQEKEFTKLKELLQRSLKMINSNLKHQKSKRK